MAVLRVLGLPIDAPPGARQVGQILIATSLGLYFTPKVVRDVPAGGRCSSRPRSSRSPAATSAAWIIARLADIDRTTALFASVPGGATEMACSASASARDSI